MSRRGAPTARTLGPGLLAILWLVLCAVPLPARADQEYPDGYLRDRANDDATLIVFVAGLAGEGSWDDFTRLMDGDGDLGSIDYFIYHSPQSLDIEENVRRIETILREIGDPYAETVYVGHSIGGIMIKRWLLRQANIPAEERNLPDLVITFGTPLDTDKFSVSLFKRLGARVFWAALPKLKQEVFNIDRIEEINKAWRTAVAQSPLSEVRRVNIFGLEDEIAPVVNETPSETTVFINGDHVGIISPATTEACSWVVFKTALIDGESMLQTIPCVLK